jgi:hypothetical protein
MPDELPRARCEYSAVLYLHPRNHLFPILYLQDTTSASGCRSLSFLAPFRTAGPGGAFSFRGTVMAALVSFAGHLPLLQRPTSGSCTLPARRQQILVVPSKKNFLVVQLRSNPAPTETGCVGSRRAGNDVVLLQSYLSTPGSPAQRSRPTAASDNVSLQEAIERYPLCINVSLALAFRLDS